MPQIIFMKEDDEEKKELSMVASDYVWVVSGIRYKNKLSTHKTRQLLCSVYKNFKSYTEK